MIVLEDSGCQQIISRDDKLENGSSGTSFYRSLYKGLKQNPGRNLRAVINRRVNWVRRAIYVSRDICGLENISICFLSEIDRGTHSDSVSLEV